MTPSTSLRSGGHVAALVEQVREHLKHVVDRVRGRELAPRRPRPSDATDADPHPGQLRDSIAPQDVSI